MPTSLTLMSTQLCDGLYDLALHFGGELEGLASTCRTRQVDASRLNDHALTIRTDIQSTRLTTGDRLTFTTFTLI
ncbi:MAG: hypothetical protein AAFR31_11360 [Cyanobacteria bacterium J06627_8]